MDKNKEPTAHESSAAGVRQGDDGENGEVWRPVADKIGKEIVILIDETLKRLEQHEIIDLAFDISNIANKVLNENIDKPDDFLA